MITGEFILPELLEEILKHVQSHIYSNIHACLFVNHQFYEHAKKILYRNLHFYPYPSSLKEEKLWNTIHHNASILSHVRSLTIDMTISRREREIPEELSPPFDERFEFIVRHARNLRRVELDTRTWNTSYQKLNAVLSHLDAAGSTPELSIDLADNNVAGGPTDSQTTERGKIMLRIREKVPIVHIRFGGRYSPKTLRYFGQFNQLRNLVLDARCVKSSSKFDDPADLGEIFKNVPLESLEIECAESVMSFPRTLKILKIDSGLYCRHSLPPLTWAAVCELRDLVELHLKYHRIDCWENSPCRFKSSTLKTFHAYPGSNNTTFARHILQPILSTASCLVSMKLKFYSNRALSSEFLSQIPSNATLSKLNITNSNENPYVFRDLVELAKNFPNLQNLALEWPATVGTHDRTEGRWPQRIRNLDIPERLTFSECTQLAAAWPRLDQIKFRLDDNMAADPYLYSKWSEIGSQELLDMPLDHCMWGDWWVRHHSLLQGFKMARFIDEASPCLNICTIFFHFDDRDHLAETSNFYREKIIMFLSLKQVRKHLDHSYIHIYIRADNRCGKECTHLLSGLIKLR